MTTRIKVENISENEHNVLVSTVDPNSDGQPILLQVVHPDETMEVYVYGSQSILIEEGSNE